MMSRKCGWVLLILLAVAPGAALAQPEFSCQNGHCPHGDYSALHYWFPEWYEARAHFHRSNLDQYPPGPFPPVPPSTLYLRNRCPSLPAMPAFPYADPERYYGRPVVPPQQLPK
jgi:hypothetical protein